MYQTVPLVALAVRHFYRDIKKFPLLYSRCVQLSAL